MDIRVDEATNLFPLLHERHGMCAALPQFVGRRGVVVSRGGEEVVWGEDAAHQK